ncbi:MAG: NAD(P)-dependent oxidoreductase [Chloroflexi bacterium]|nr:NAD(P)-dependent oxidoreductase [Chloroflexota bacterium]
MDTLGIIGAGQMGGGMWRNLHKKGRTAMVYDVRTEACQPLALLGAKVAESPGDIASQCSELILSLPKSDDVEQACLGPGGVIEGAKPGTTVIDATSGEPIVTKRISARLAGKRINMVDMGVSGGPLGALNGTLLIMLGGDKAVVDKHNDLFKLLGQRIHYCGGSGAGHAMKTLLNLRNQVINIITAEVLLIGAKAGLEPKKVVEVTGAGAIWDNYILNPEGRKAIGFALALACKDFDVAQRLAMDVGVPGMVASTGRDVFHAALAEVGKDADVFRFVDALEKWAGHNLPGHPKGR